MSLSLKFEDRHTIVISSCKIVERGMGSQDPVSIGVSPRLLDLHPSVEVPQSQGLVF